MRHARSLVTALMLAALAPTQALAADVTPEPFLEGLSFPTNMAFAPDGTLFFTEKETGNVRVVTPEGTLVDRPFITVPVIPEAERGLLGIALHPAFHREPWVYLYFSDPADGRNRLVRVRAAGVVAVGEPQTLFEGLSAAAGYHNGGDLAFGIDGTLFVSVGEAHEPDRAQDPGDVGGKVLRLAGDGSVPADNPFGPDSPVWSIGHRNSFGLCVDPRTGELWETENGPDRDDEVNLIEPGANYGWPVVTGDAGDERFNDPFVVFREPIALTGCAVVDGDLWFGSFDGRLWHLPAPDRASRRVEEAARFPAGVTDVTLGPDGELYAATSDAIWTLHGVTGTPTSSSASLAPATERPGTTEPAPPAEAGEPRGSWRSWIAIGAMVVLASALGARFLAGRRLRDEPRPDR